jgi:hypothetical protein
MSGIVRRTNYHSGTLDHIVELDGELYYISTYSFSNQYFTSIFYGGSLEEIDVSTPIDEIGYRNRFDAENEHYKICANLEKYV